jgi:hypothetical protein
MTIEKIKTTNEFTIEITYENGELREFDMKPLLPLKPWTKLQNVALFHQAQIFYNTIIWPGEIDIAPETLYLDSKLISPSGAV